MNDYYGVDPATPRDLRDLSDLCRLFRPSEGRFLMGYPHDWGRRLEEHMGQLSDLNRLRAVEVFRAMKHSIIPVPSRARYDDRRAWSENALSIRDLVSKLIGPPDCPATVEPLRKLLDVPDSFPESREARIPRTVAAYVQAAKPLFLTSPKVVLVDRFFGLNMVNKQTQRVVPDARRREVLRAFLGEADAGRIVRVFRLAVSVSKACPGDPTGAGYAEALGTLAYEVTRGRVSCELQDLDDASDDVDGGEHPRYLLGLHSGLHFDWGFDLDTRIKSKSTNHVSWLTKSVLDPLLDRYA